jgi:hypothetical protein
MRFGTFAAPLAAAVLFAGCGGSSGSSSKSSTTTTAASTLSVSSASTTPTSFASGSNCLQLAGVGAEFAEAIESAAGVKFNEAGAASDFQKLANAAPSAIRADLETVATAFTAFAADFKKSGYEFGKTPTASQAAALESAVAVFEQPKLKAADAALKAWVTKNCT